MNGKGFTRASHEIFDKAEGELSNSQFKVFWHIYRQLVGWNRESAELSVTKIMQKLNLSMPTVIAACKELAEGEWIRMEKAGKQKNSPVIFYLSDELQEVVKLFNNQPVEGENVIKLFNNQSVNEELVIKKFNNPINNDLKDNKNIYIYGNKEKGADKLDLLSKLEFLPGIIDISKEMDKKYHDYIAEFSAEKIDTVIAEAKRRTKLPTNDKDKLQRKAVLKFIAGGLENYDIFYGKGEGQATRDKADPIEPIGRLRSFLDSPIAGDYSPAVIVQRLEDKLPLFDTHGDEIAQRFNLSITDWQGLIDKYRGMANAEEVY